MINLIKGYQERFILLGLLLLAFVSRFIFISSTDISHDEPFSIFHSQAGVPEIIQRLKPYNNPPLFEIILHFWTKITGGISPIQVRSLSLLFSVLTIVPLFLMVNKFKGKLVAISVCLIFIFSSYHIGFSHEARTYSMWLFFTVCSIYYFSILISELNSKKLHLALYIFFTTLMLYSHFFAIWVIFSQGIFLLLFNRNKLFSKPILISFSVILVLFLPYIKIILVRFTDSASSGTWVETPPPSELYETIRKFCNQPVIAIAFIGSFILSVTKIKNDLFLKYLLIAFVVPFFSIFLLSYKIPMFVDRYLIFTSIPFYILSASSLIPFIKNAKSNFMLLVLPLIMILTCNYDPRLKYENSKVANLIPKYKNETVGVIYTPEWIDINMYYYLDKKLFNSPNDYKKMARKKNYFATNNVDEVPSYKIIILIEGEKNYLDKSRENYKKLKNKYPIAIEIKDKDGTNFEGYIVTLFSN